MGTAKRTSTSELNEAGEQLLGSFYRGAWPAVMEPPPDGTDHVRSHAGQPRWLGQRRLREQQQRCWQRTGHRYGGGDRDRCGTPAMEAHTIQCYFFYFAAIFRATSQQPSKQCLEHCC
eukprot:COSAG02_NODE_5968_length_3902_cov_5.539574_5_plen_117_part_01